MENQLQTIIASSGLEPTKAEAMLKQFGDYFSIAADWERKAKAIVVTDVSQQADMAMARVGRLFLREKRIAVEKTRKEMKEQSMREGKAIDGIANVLKALIVPIEEHLERQERFAEIRAAEESARLAAEESARVESERLAAETAEAEERERIRLENIRLKQEAEEKERALAAERARVEAERKAAEAKATAEREAAESRLAAERAKAEAEKKAAEEKVRQERIKAQATADMERQKAEAARRQAEAEAAKKLAAERAKAEAERIAAEAKATAERIERERLEAIIAAMVTCPECGHKFTPNQKGN